MKRIIFVLMLLPQLAYSQYRAGCFSLGLSDNVSHNKIGNTFDRDTTLNISVRTTISGLSISGTAVLDNDNDSYIRVTLVDNYNYEFLVYENYPALSDDLTTKFTNIALETILLDDITPQSLKISMLNASLELDTISYSNTPANNRHNSNNPVAIQKAQIRYIVDKLNTTLEKRNMTWRAGITSISEKTYSEKKDMFGGIVPELYGFEHYIGGVFVIPGEYLNSLSRSTSSSQYVSEWDWRNRHEKNWMTSVNFHEKCGGCWAFASISAIEAYANLYYNRLINLDLSEEEIISCSTQNGCSGGTEYAAFNYIKNYGVVNESCFSYADTVLSCSLKCSTPSEKIYIQDYSSIAINEDSIKSHLFKCPLTIAFGGEWKHSMVVVGYKKIEIGDKIYLGNNSAGCYVIINGSDHQNLIGRTAWILKNSWEPWGGYLYAIVDINYPQIWRIISLTGRITSLNYDDSDIVCEDADGDGYYFWGLGPKPSYCPSWVPDIPDGNDGDSSKGLMDQYGNLESLNANNTLIICGNVTYTSSQTLKCNIRIPSNTSLTIRNTLNLFGRVKIYIESNGQLIVDGGVVTNADINMSSSGKIKLKNGGIIVMQTGKDFNVPTGATLDIDEGKFIRSNDF